MLAGISKLRLEPGDVVVVEHPDTLKALSQMKVPINFNVPLVYAPAGLKKLTRQDLLNLLEQLDQQATVELPVEHMSAPI